jgi:exonuclease 3'-5' domain-containing protein 1
MTTSPLAPTLISSLPELKIFLSSIPPTTTLYLDLEGNSLSRHGTISLITLLVHPTRVIRLIDVLVLGKSAFTTATKKNGKTLKSILEDPNIPKYVWDVRNDADALWALYRVRLAGVTDIQLLENASRPSNKTYVWGLDKSVQYDLRLRFMELNRWIRTRKEMKSLMPADVFAARPIGAKTIQYCVNDVVHLPDLYTLYLGRMQGDWYAKAMEQSALRVAEACSPGYEPQSASKKLGPWGSGIIRHVMTLDETVEDLWEQWMGDAAELEMLVEDEDVGYYDYDDDDWGGTNAADGAFCPEAFDSCWDKN